MLKHVRSWSLCLPNAMFLSFLTHITLLEVFLDKIFQINDVLHIKYKLSYQTPGWGGGSIA